MTFAQLTPLSTATLALPKSVATLPAWPPTGRQIANKPAGGFFQCPTDFLTLPWGLYRDGQLPFLALRTWYGLLELPERRCDCPLDQDVHYSLGELCALLHVPRRAPVQAALRTLENLGLVAWSAASIRYLPEPAVLQERTLPGYQALQAHIPAWRTWVPAPRRLLRWLAREGTPGLCATAAGVLLRCLWSKKRQCVSGGRVAASWIAAGFGVAERTVQRALDALQDVGWLARLPSTNAADNAAERRWGARTVVNLAWNAPGAAKCQGADEAPGLDKVSREKSRPKRREVAVEHCVKHTATFDQNLSPLAGEFDQNLSPTPPVEMPETLCKSSACDARSDFDFYPLQEQRPDPVPATRARDLPTGVWQNTPEKDTHHLQTAVTPVTTPLALSPASATADRLEDPAEAFVALSPAAQEELLQAATARLLARGVSAAFLIRSALLAEVYAQMERPSLGAPPDEACPAAPVVVSRPQEPSVQAAAAVAPSLPPASRRPALLADPAVAFAALPLAEQDALLAAVTARLLAQGLREDFLIRPVLLAEVYAQMAPPSVAEPGAGRREAPTASSAVPHFVAPAQAKTSAVDTPPSLSDVVPADLRDLTRLEALRQQAIRRGWLTGCDADRLNFVAAAVHARRIGATPCALFVAVVRDKRWEVITDGDEDEARALLRERAAGRPRPATAAPARGLSDDACVVRGVQQLLRQAGSDADAFAVVAQRDATWTRARWNAALAELYGLSGGLGLERLGEVLGAED